MQIFHPQLELINGRRLKTTFQNLHPFFWVP